MQIVDSSNGTDVTYVDGWLGNNNPSEVALQEARKIWPTYTQSLGSSALGPAKQKQVLSTLLGLLLLKGI